MWNPSDKELAQDIREAVSFRDKHVLASKKIVLSYVGQHFRSDLDDRADKDPENFVFAYVSNMLPDLVYSNPTVKVNAARVVGGDVLERAMTSAINTWIVDMDLAEKIRELVVDFLMMQAVALVALEPDPAFGNDTLRPRCHHLHYSRVFIDPLATKIDEAEYVGHDFYMNLEELQEHDAQGRLNPGAMDRLTRNAGPTGERDAGDPLTRPESGTVSRRRVRLRSVWLRDSGMIRVFAADDREFEVYAPEPYYGPETGPYVIAGAYPVPNSPYRLSPLVASFDQIEALSEHGRALERSASRRKTIAVVDGQAAKLANVVVKSKDGEVHSVAGFSKDQLATIELGGASDSQYYYQANKRTNVQRTVGMSEARMGGASGAATATENAIADRAGQGRNEDLRNMIAKMTSKILWNAGWFFFNSTSTMVRVSVRDPNSGMDVPKLFLGGRFPDDGPARGEDFGVSIEPYSMQRVNEALLQQRMTEFMNSLVAWAPLMPQMPWIDWPALLRTYAESINVKNADEFVRWQLLQMAPVMRVPPGSGSSVIPGTPGTPGTTGIPGPIGPSPNDPYGVYPQPQELVGGPRGDALRMGDQMRRANSVGAGNSL